MISTDPLITVLICWIVKRRINVLGGHDHPTPVGALNTVDKSLMEFGKQNSAPLSASSCLCSVQVLHPSLSFSFLSVKWDEYS